MLDEVLVQAATAGSTAIATAAGTQVWETTRAKVAALFAKRSTRAEQRALEQLDHDRTELEAAGTDTAPQTRTKVQERWETRIGDLLGELDDDERDPAMREIADLAEQVRRHTGTDIRTGDHSVVVHGNSDYKADHGSAAGVFTGPVTLGPQQPGTDQD